MSYDNAEPKILKTLNSNGQVLDSSGEVIANTSDYWVKTYNQAEPKPDKILNSDGTITDSAGNLIQDTTPFNVKKYNQAEPIPAKYLHSDGTIDENPGSGSGADLEDNHQTTIDVSTYTEPVEITPIAGKDGMKKATITLSNIPSGGGTGGAYAWTSDDGQNAVYFDFNECPSGFDFSGHKIFEAGHIYNYGNSLNFANATRSSDTSFTSNGFATRVYTRDASLDYTLWEAIGRLINDSND